jgi:flagellar basal body-associated protein FliL
VNTLLSLTFTLILIITLTSSCSKKSSEVTKRSTDSVALSVSYEKFVDDRVTLTLPQTDLNESSAVVSLQISYTGKEGIKDVFQENESLILDLIRTKAASFSLNELRKGDGLTRFEGELLDSINTFIAKDLFVKVQVSDIKEI